MSFSGQQITAELARLGAELAAASARGGHGACPRLIAVSKRHPSSAIKLARDAGQIDFGENFAKELAAKADDFSDDDEIVWHFIGRLQRNKVKWVVGTATLIHAVDSHRLLKEIDRWANRQGRIQAILLAVNVSGESSKSGIRPDQIEGMLNECDQLGALRCHGLMTMPPWPETAEDNRAYFRELRNIRDKYATTENPLTELSMGTSGDCVVAAEEGATLIRVGTRIFGPRTPSQP